MPRLSKRNPKLCLHLASGLGYAKYDGHRVYFGAYGTPACRAAYDRMAICAPAENVKPPGCSGPRKSPPPPSTA